MQITQFFEKNKKMSLKRLNVEKIQAIYLPKSSSTKNEHIFVRAKRVPTYYGKCAYYGCSYFEWGQESQNILLWTEF